MSERITPDEAIDAAPKLGALGISLGLAKELRADRDALRSRVAALEAELKRVEGERCMARDKFGHYSTTEWIDRAERSESSLKAAGEALIEKILVLDLVSNDAVVRGQSGEESMRTRIIGLIASSLVLPSPTKASPQEPVNTWYCGCGHTNGCNLATCAACSRPPGGWPEEQAERYQSGGNK